MNDPSALPLLHSYNDERGHIWPIQ